MILSICRHRFYPFRYIYFIFQSNMDMDDMDIIVFISWYGYNIDTLDVLITFFGSRSDSDHLKMAWSASDFQSPHWKTPYLIDLLILEHFTAITHRSRWAEISQTLFSQMKRKHFKKSVWNDLQFMEINSMPCWLIQ